MLSEAPAAAGGFKILDVNVGAFPERDASYPVAFHDILYSDARGLRRSDSHAKREQGRPEEERFGGPLLVAR